MFNDIKTIFIYVGSSHSSRVTRLYHIQYFGVEMEHGWVSEASALPYEGKEKLDQQCLMMLESTKDKKKFSSDVPKARRVAWDIATAASEEAFTMERNDRRQKYTFVYIDAPGSKQKSNEKKSPISDAKKTRTPKNLPNGMPVSRPRKYTKRKLQELVNEKAGLLDISSGADFTLEPPKKKRKRSKSSSNVPLSPSGAASPSRMASQGITQFLVFCQKKHEGIKKENPGIINEDVGKKLREMWDSLDEEQRSRFIPMGTDVNDLDKMYAYLDQDSPTIGKFNVYFSCVYL